MSRASAEVGSAANSYEILAKLAMGGMAEIFLARGASAAGVERYVVLKRILRQKSQDQAFIRMFLDEARLAAQLQHPNIAQVYDIGKLGDSYFFTMEYVHGETVRNLLQRSHGLRRQIPVASTLTVIAGAAAGLHHAHDRKGMDGKPLGIVHRDVSPSNLMVSYEGTLKVVDFGVAKAAHRDTETRSGTVKGKITYMSPEQCKGGDIDRRSDLFSLGIVMWEMLTTERLFRRNSDFENMQAIVAEDVPPPSSLRREISPEIDAIVMKLLAKKPQDRYQTADEVHEAIEEAAVRSGSALSASGLGRFMRELFGQRPEPWIELQTNHEHPEAFTVTSEPLAPALIESPEDELDLKLSAMPSLNPRMSSQHDASPMPPERPPQPTIPLRVQAEDLAVTMHHPGAPLPFTGTPAFGVAKGPSHPTLPMPAAPPPVPLHQTPQHGTGSIPHIPAAMQSFTPSASAAMGIGPANPTPMRPHSPSVTPQSSPQYPVLGSASHSTPSYSSLGANSRQEPRRSRALIILIPAALVGIIIGVVMAVGGEKPTEPADRRVAMTPGSAEPSTNSGGQGSDEEPTPVEKPGPGSGSAGSATPVIDMDEPEVAPDTTPVGPKPVDTKPVDTKPDDTKPVDTKPKECDPFGSTEGCVPKANTKPVDTKPVDTKPIDTKKPPDNKGQVKVTPPVAPDIATLYKTAKYSDVIRECSSSSKVLTNNSTTCTLAACKAKDKTAAKKFLGSVSTAKRAGVIKDCGGVLPAEKSPANDDACKRDPLSCQH